MSGCGCSIIIGIAVVYGAYRLVRRWLNQLDGYTTVIPRGRPRGRWEN